MDKLNELPNDWQWAKLGDICDFIDYRGLAPLKSETGVILITAKNVRMGYLKNEPREYISKEEFKRRMARGIIKFGDILFTTEAPMGNVTLLNTTNTVSIGQRIIALRPNNNAHNVFVMFAIMSGDVQKQIESLSTGSTVKGISSKHLLEIKIPFPTLKTQQRLAALLTEKLALVEQAKQKIEATHEAAEKLTAAYLRAVFESDEAKGWELVKLSDIADFKNGINFNAAQKGNGTLITDIFNMYSNSIYLENVNDFYRISGELDENHLLNEKDILFVRSSVKKEGVGWATLFNGHFEAVTFCGFIIRARMTLEVCQEFIVFYFRSPLIRQAIIAKAGSSTITNINQGHLKSFMIPLPPLEKQKELATYLSEKIAIVEQLKTTLLAQLESVNQIRTALLKQAFNGEL